MPGLSESSDDECTLTAGSGPSDTAGMCMARGEPPFQVRSPAPAPKVRLGWICRSSSPAPPARSPSARRGLPALLLRAGGDRLLFDCGEGTQQQLLRSIGLPEIDAVFFTHYHLDHWLGLLGMVKTFDLRARERELALYGPPGLRALIEAMRPVIGRTGYPLEVVELEPHAEVRRGGYLVAAFPVDHRVTAYGYAFAEDDRPGRFDAAGARALGVAEGPDFGRLQRGEQVGGVRPEQVVGPVRRGRRIVISGDTRPCQTIEVYAHGADLLVHEATFLDDERVRARETAHSTARQAAELAQRGRRAACSR